MCTLKVANDNDPNDPNDRLNAWPRCANYRMALAVKLKAGLIYECNRTDDSMGKSFAHYSRGESIYIC